MERNTASPMDRMKTMKQEIKNQKDFEGRRQQMEHLFNVIGEVGKMTVNFDQAMKNLEKIRRVNPDKAETILDSLSSWVTALVEYFNEWNERADKTDEYKNEAKKLSLEEDPRFAARDHIPLIRIPEIFERINELASTIEA